MKNANSFLEWLEGYLDASKNKLSEAQVKEIRKKMKEVTVSSKTVALYDSSNNLQANDDFIREVESRKFASTMEDLLPKE